MTEEGALRVVDLIRKQVERSDEDSARLFEQSLYIEFVRWCAERRDAVGKVARVVLASRDIDFRR